MWCDGKRWQVSWLQWLTHPRHPDLDLPSVEHPIQGQNAPQAPGAGVALTAVPPHWQAFSVVPHLFVETISLNYSFLFSFFPSFAVPSPDRLGPHEEYLTAASSSRPRRQAAQCSNSRDSRARVLVLTSVDGCLKSYTVRLSGLVSGEGTALPLSRPAAIFSGVYLNGAWSDAARLGNRGSLPHNVSHLTTLACERRSIAPAEPTCQIRAPSTIGSLGQLDSTPSCS